MAVIGGWLYWWRSASPLLSDASDGARPARRAAELRGVLPPCQHAPRRAPCPRSSSSVAATPASTPRGSSRSTSARARPRSRSSTRCPYMTYQPFLPEVAAGSIEAAPRGRRAAPPPQAHEGRHREGHRHQPRREGRDDHARASASRTSSSTTIDRRHRRRRLAHVPDPGHRRQRDRPQDDRRGRRDPRPAA